MADNKYGEIYTEDELVKVVQMAIDEVISLSNLNKAWADDIRDRFTEGNIREVARTEVERKFLPGEPLFILRGQDKRALGAVRWYRDHQWPNSTQEHTDKIDDAVALFEAYRKVGTMKEPD